MKKIMLSLQEISLKDVSTCGGKAANLGELMKVGLNVPKGFVITTEAYEYKNSKELNEAILQEFDKLNSKYVAVRSSAISEDSSNFSWAGQLATYLFTDRESLLENIQSCWESVNSSRAKAYQQDNKLEVEEGGVAVIVQEMIDADTSGVTFTVHPVTKDANTVVIEAIYGLGEAIVSGIVTPDSYEIDKRNNKIINADISNQRIKIVQASKGTKSVEIPLEHQEEQKLSFKEIEETAKISKIIESHYNSPQDIEWCWKDGKLFILQARPITTL